MLILPHALLSQLLLQLGRQVLLQYGVKLQIVQVWPAAVLTCLSCTPRCETGERSRQDHGQSRCHRQKHMEGAMMLLYCAP